MLKGSPIYDPRLHVTHLLQLRGGCSAAFSISGPDGAETMAVVAEVQQTSGLDGEALASAIRRSVAADHGASLATVRLLRPR